MIIQDDRDRDQRETHLWAIAATDSYMSGWGGATGGRSVAAWAFREGEEQACRAWVESRTDMKRVRLVLLSDWRPRAAHVHVYVWGPR